MSQLLKMKNKNEIKRSAKDFLSPDYILIPILNGFNLDIKTEDIIFKGQTLQNKEGVNIFSPVSGKVMGAKNIVLPNGTSTNSIVIENDFKEKYASSKGMKRKIDVYKPEEIIELLKLNGIFSGKENPRFLYELFKEKGNLKTIVVNALDIENTVANNKFILKDKFGEILETIDTITEIFGIDCILVIDANDLENANKFLETIGIYPNIKIKTMPNNYPNSLECVLVKSVLGPKADDNGNLFLTIENILAINDCIKRNKVTAEKYITISGDAIENPVVLIAKIGSFVKPIIAEIIKFRTNKNIVFYINGEINGKLLQNIDDLIITPELQGIYITTLKEKIANNCISCGKCKEACPININPKFIRENINNPEKLKNAKKETCIKCGICSYVCPSNIDYKKIFN